MIWYYMCGWNDLKMGKPSSSQNEETERKAGFGCELAPKIPEGKIIISYSLIIIFLAREVHTSRAYVMLRISSYFICM